MPAAGQEEEQPDKNFCSRRCQQDINGYKRADMGKLCPLFLEKSQKNLVLRLISYYTCLE